MDSTQIDGEKVPGFIARWPSENKGWYHTLHHTQIRGKGRQTSSTYHGLVRLLQPPVESLLEQRYEFFHSLGSKSEAINTSSAETRRASEGQADRVSNFLRRSAIVLL